MARLASVHRRGMSALPAVCRLVALCLLVCALPARAHAIWSEYAMISATLGVSDSRICIGEASRGDIGCPSFAPTISPTGRINASAGLTVDAVSLTTGGTTWGYLGSSSSYLPNLNTNNISLSTINGVSISALGGGASPTNVPGFVAHRNSIAQTSVPVNTWAKVNLTHESYDNYNSFNTANGRFQPNVAGNYIITAGVACSSAGPCYAGIFKNGVGVYTSGHSQSPAGQIFATTSGIVQLNGTTDYVELWGYTDGTSFVGMPASTYFSGSLLASGNGLISGTGVTALSALTDVALSSPATGQVLTYNGSSWVNATPSATTVISGTTSMLSGWPDALVCGTTAGTETGSIYVYNNVGANAAGVYAYRIFSGTAVAIDHRFNNSSSVASFFAAGGVNNTNCNGKTLAQLYADGQAFNFIGNTGAVGSAMGDRLTSGTLAVTANSATAIVSLTTGGTTWGYLGSAGSYLPSLTSSKVSATTISTTAVQVVSATAPLTCDSGKAGTLRYNSANTALELCTGTGWQVMGVGIPAGTISAFASTTCPTGWSEYTPARGRFLRGIDNGAGNDPSGTRVPGNVQNEAVGPHSHTFKLGQTNGSGYNGWSIQSTSSFINFGVDSNTGPETRPKNVAVTYCQFNGTSNGWNNPLSGGSTTPGGSTGQIQYNTSGSFDASAGLTWDNAASRLTTVNISATALTVNGVAITGSASGDRIVSGSTSAVATPAGTIAVSGTLTLQDNPAAGCVSGTLGAVAQRNSKMYFCRM